MRTFIMMFAVGFVALTISVDEAPRSVNAAQSVTPTVGLGNTAWADGPYCAPNTHRCNNREDNGFVCCSEDTQCCHRRGNGSAYCDYSCN
ncbi:MAG: hypothetical protein WC551_04120 [Patescibacteria group bacterium]